MRTRYLVSCIYFSCWAFSQSAWAQFPGAPMPRPQSGPKTPASSSAAPKTEASSPGSASEQRDAAEQNSATSPRAESESRPQQPAPAAAAPVPRVQAATDLNAGAPLAEPGSLVLRPPLLPAYKDMPPPPGYVLQSRANRPLVALGSVGLVVGYGFGLVYGATQKFKDNTGWLALPLIGPWVGIAKRDFQCDIEASTDSADECQQKTVDQATKALAMGAAGLTQLFGVGVTVVGLLVREKRWIRSDLVEKHQPQFSAYPTLGGGFFSARFIF